MKNCKIWIGFVLALLMSIIQSALFPIVSLSAFIPFLGLLCLLSPFSSALWLATLAGCCSDLLGSDPPGVHALSNTILCALMHRYHRYFKEHPLQLPLCSALLAVALLPVEWVVLFVFEGNVESRIAVLDIVEAPLLGGGYAFCWFVGPLALWDWGKMQWTIWKLKQKEVN
jgi:rod shape-determining protein MreD